AAFRMTPTPLNTKARHGLSKTLWIHPRRAAVFKLVLALMEPAAFIRPPFNNYEKQVNGSRCAAAASTPLGPAEAISGAKEITFALRARKIIGAFTVFHSPGQEKSSHSKAFGRNHKAKSRCLVITNRCAGATIPPPVCRSNCRKPWPAMINVLLNTAGDGRSSWHSESLVQLGGRFF